MNEIKNDKIEEYNIIIIIILTIYIIIIILYIYCLTIKT